MTLLSALGSRYHAGVSKKKKDAAKKQTKKTDDLEEVVLTDEEADKVTGGTIEYRSSSYTLTYTRTDSGDDDPPTTDSPALNN
jgi:hypothetical protein